MLRGRRRTLVPVLGALTLLAACNAVLGNEDHYLVKKDAASTECLLPSDCPTGNVCLFKTCSPPCRADGDCDPGMRCLETEQGTACISSTQSCTEDTCPDGSVCAGATCRNECGGTGGSPCRSDQTCSAGVCVGKDSTHDPGTGLQEAGATGGAGGREGTGGRVGTGGRNTDSGAPESGAGGAVAADGGDAAAPSPPCDPLETPDENDGVFVSVTAGAAGGDGSAVSPLNSIMDALALARASGRSVVYLDQGTYTEAVDIADSTTGVFIRGGWRYTGLVWQRDCQPDAALLTLIRPNRTVGVQAIDVVHASGLQDLSVTTQARLASPPANTAGASRIAVLVRGTGSAFRLLGVRLLAANADHGGAATSGTPGGAASCQGQLDCGDGVSPASGGNGSDATTSGSFTPDGFTPASGQAGSRPGADGHNGTHGAAAVRTDCNTGCGCNGCFTAYDGTASAAAGDCGCGGKGGGPGGAGKGGGSSVGLLVSGTNAAVDVRYTSISSADGGDGSPGGAGGIGSAGTPGAAGQSARCHRTDCIGGCGVPADCGYSDVGVLLTGPNGGNGGRGADGAKGGGGAGGPSYAVVTLGGARVITDAFSLLAHGDPGTGAGTAPAGASGDTESFP